MDLLAQSAQWEQQAQLAQQARPNTKETTTS
jgi:hypothetical protein